MPCFKFSRLGFCLVLILAFKTGFAKSHKVPKPGQVINTYIEEGYKSAMNTEFLRLANLARKHSKSADFFSAMFYLKPGSDGDKKIQKVEKDKLTPKIIQIENGISIINDGKNTDITLAKTFGHVSKNGVEVAENKSNEPHEIQSSHDLFSWLKIILPQAMALPNPLNFLKWFGEQERMAIGMANISEETFKIEHVTFGERILGNIKSTAALAGTGAATGCFLANSFKEKAESYSLSACGEGALYGALAGVAAQGLTALSFGMVDVTFLAIEAGANAKKFQPFAKVAGVSKSIQNLSMFEVISGVGITAIVAGGLNEVTYWAGTKYVCGSKGNYEMKSLDVGAQKSLYSFKDGKIALYHDDYGGKSIDEIAKYLGEKKGFKDMKPEILKSIATNISAETQAISESCKKHGEGYTESFRFPSEPQNQLKGNGSLLKGKPGSK